MCTKSVYSESMLSMVVVISYEFHLDTIYSTASGGIKSIILKPINV